MLYFEIGPLKKLPTSSFISAPAALAGSLMIFSLGMSLMTTGKLTPSTVALED